MGILAYLAWFGPNMYEGSFIEVQKWKEESRFD